MDSLGQHYYLLLFSLYLVIATFILVGSVVAFRSKITPITTALLTASSINFISISLLSFSQYKMQGLLIYSPDEALNGATIERYNNIYTYSFYANLSGSAIFAFAFILFCFSMANMRKRNEQLEFLNAEIAKRDSKN